MKLKTKLLTIIAPAAVLTTVAPIALTSCGGGGGGDTPEVKTNTISFAGDNKVTTTTSLTYNLEFTLEHKLASGQTLTAYVNNKSGTGDLKVSKVNVDGTKVTLNMTISMAGSGASSTYAIDFTCKSGTTTDWTSKISGFRFIYSK